jgi:2-polyprenyl-6-methoxyphenol hydroxylase-like FAD-dependent oxidoreductase
MDVRHHDQERPHRRIVASKEAMMDVGVVGCGTAGPAAALLLARAGHRVTVYERVAEPGPVGAGILLQPTGQAVLARLGLLERVRARASPVERLLCQRVSGRPVVDLRYDEIGTPVGLGIHRGVLFEALFAALRAEPGVALELGCDALRTEEAGGRRWVVDAAGARRGPHDLVVVADGADSAIRLLPELRVRADRNRWGALWFVARDPDGAFGGRLFQVVDGAQRMLGLLPTGLGPRGAQPIVSLFWSIRADRVDSWRAGGLSGWKDEVLAMAPAAAPVLAQIESPAQVLFAGYRDVRMRRWHAAGAVVLGDAAHATSPQLGQGANLALWDALVLADTLAAGGDLAAYSRARRAHLRYYQLAARWLTPLFQSDSRFAGWLRDRCLPLFNRIGPTRRMMTATMAGIRRGLLRCSIRVTDP